MSACYRFLRALQKEPWLEPYVEDHDETIDAARERFERDQEAALRRLLNEGIQVPHRRFTKPGGLLTTGLDPRGETR